LVQALSSGPSACSGLTKMVAKHAQAIRRDIFMLACLYLENYLPAKQNFRTRNHEDYL
jgi:hypothetical protein